MTRTARRRAPGLLVILMGLALLQLPVNPVFAKEAQAPEVSHDGLHRVHNAKVALLYEKPDLDLSGYNKLLALDCYVAFQKNWRRDIERNTMTMPITKREMDGIKKRVANTFRKEFAKDIGKAGYPTVTEAAHDVVIVRPALINLYVAAPDLMRPGMTDVYVDSRGAVTLILELYDSLSGEILLRAVDREVDRQVGMGIPASRVTNVAFERDLVAHWAKLLGKALHEVHPRSAQ